MKSRPVEVKARILENERIRGPYYRLRLFCPEIAALARPGQFLMVRVKEGYEPLLRRPFSFARIHPEEEAGRREKGNVKGGEVEIWYKIVGRGTTILSQLREDDQIDVLGPLGNGFWSIGDRSWVLLLAGGMGIAPLFALAENYCRQSTKVQARLRSNPVPRLNVLWGGKSGDDAIGIRELETMGILGGVATEDGSLGVRGLATDLLERTLLTLRPETAVIYACGPWAMLSRVAEMAFRFDIPCQVLLETRMACGLGACLGCTILMKGNYVSEAETRNASKLHPRRESSNHDGRKEVFPKTYRHGLACQEGPVFEARDIVWESRNL
jgi:dihydroorotate dehydrogenase electron transfer subunit